jgi:hypothetical protein
MSTEAEQANGLVLAERQPVKRKWYYFIWDSFGKPKAGELWHDAPASTRIRAIRANADRLQRGNCCSSLTPRC